jgi:hypothetical protein
MNGERLTLEVDRERGKVTTLKKLGVSLHFLHFPGTQQKDCSVRCPQRSKSKIHFILRSRQCALQRVATARR